MNSIRFTRIYQTLFQLFNQLDDSDEKERQISFMIFDIMNKMEKFWGDE